MISKENSLLQQEKKATLINMEELCIEEENEKPEIRIHRDKLFRIISYLVNMIEKESYVIKTRDINLSNIDILVEQNKYVLHRIDYKLAYLVPLSKSLFVNDYIDTLFTRHDKGKNAEQIINDDLLKLNINNNNYAILTYFKENDGPYITYRSGEFITYDPINKHKNDSKIKLVDNKFNYIYEYLDLVYGYAISKSNKKVSYKELKILALYYATNYMNKDNNISIKKIGQKI